MPSTRLWKPATVYNFRDKVVTLYSIFYLLLPLLFFFFLLPLFVALVSFFFSSPLTKLGARKKRNKPLNKIKKNKQQGRKNIYMFFPTHEGIHKNITNIAVGIYTQY
jgi:uncharacterized membrane protein